MLSSASHPIDRPQDQPQGQLEALRAPLHISQATLLVHDLDAMTQFYERSIGLAVLARQPGETLLGAADATPLLLLRHDPATTPARHSGAGLFHIAYLLPQRSDLAAWLAHAARSGLLLQGASDHLVSEALYLEDPEGNGIEIYVDRPRVQWKRDGEGIAMATHRLDLNALLALAPDASSLVYAMPPGVRIGHVHLKVGDLAAAQSFYSDRLGLEIMCRYPDALFFAAGGYHHHIATNIWTSRGAGRRQANEAGLAELELAITDQAFLAQLQHKLKQADWNGARLSFEDPYGTRFTVATPSGF
jgi:catechol 2,3-dioxygenase